MIDSLKIEDSHAKAIIQLAIDNNAYDGDMPSTKKDRIEAAHDIVTFAIDAWVQDEVRSDSDDDDLKKAGKTVEKILKIAGVKVNESGVVGYDKPAKVKDVDKSKDEEGDEEEEEEEEEDDEGVDLSTLSRAELKKLIKDNEIEVKVLKSDSDDDIRAKIEAAVGEGEEEEEEEEEESEGEAPFDVNDIIAGWSDMKTTAALKAIEENADELDQEQVKALLDDEQSGSKPRSKITDALEAVLNAQMGGDDEEGEEEGGEPWDGYDGASVKAVKETLEAAKEDEDEPLDVEQAQFVLAYEKENKSRAGIIKWLEEFIAAADSSDDEEEEEEEEGDETADEAGDGDGEEEEDDDEGVDLDELDRAELKALIKEQEWDITVQKKWSDDDLRKEIAKYVESQEEEEEEEEPEPESPKKQRGAKKGKSEDPDDSNDVDDAVAEDDEKDAKKAKTEKRKKAGAFVVAFSLNGGEIEMTFDGKNAALGSIADALDQGAESVGISIGG